MYKSFLLSIFLLCAFFTTTSFAGGKHDLSFKVARGDAFYKFFFSTGLSGDLLTKLMTSDARAQRLNNIYPGDKFRIILNDDHGLEQIIFSPANDNPLFIFYDGQSMGFNEDCPVELLENNEGRTGLGIIREIPEYKILSFWDRVEIIGV